MEVILLVAIVVTVVVIFLIVSYINKEPNKKEMPYHISYSFRDLEEVYHVYHDKIYENIPERYEIEINGVKYIGQFHSMYYTEEYGQFVCKYMSLDDTIIYCTYDDEIEFLSATFLNPIKLLENMTEDNVKKQLELYVGEKNDYEFKSTKMDDKICCAYVKTINGFETSEGVRIVMDSIGKVYWISKYTLDKEVKDVNQQEIDEADKRIMEKIYESYGENCEYEILGKQIIFINSRGKAINYFIKIRGEESLVKYQVSWRQVQVEICDCES